MMVGSQESALSQLNVEQKKLFDVIADLRKYKVDGHVDIPQIVVIGDQSSGKSSVLEAISRVRFSSKSDLCTRFPIVLALRTETRQPAVHVHILGEHGSITEMETSTTEILDTDELPSIIEKAGDKMVRDHSGFSRDVLRIEVRGPRVPHLTLIDLPGFYQPENQRQSAQGVQLAESLAEKYMARKNTIILAIVSAHHDLMLQSVLSQVKKHDPKGERTLGIITKPDLLAPGKENNGLLLLAANQDKSHALALGWHVLRNRSESEKSDWDEVRDQRECEFLDQAPWSSIPASNRGAAALRSKLSKLLMQHIQATLPSLLDSIQTKMVETQTMIKQLGEPRTTPREMRTFLVEMALQFQTLSAYAIEGNYDDRFFGGLDPSEDLAGRVKKLRGLVRDLNRVFAHIMSTKGARQTVVYSGPTYDPNHGQHWSLSIPPHVEKQADVYKFPDPENVTVAAMTAQLEILSSLNQGNKFTGSSNDLLALKLFQDQIEPWKNIARFHIQLITDCSKTFVEQLFIHTLAKDDDAPFKSICQNLIDPFFAQRTSALEEKLDELLYHYREGHSQPFDGEFCLNLDARKASDPVQTLLATRPNLFTDAGREELKAESRRQAEGPSRVLDILHKSEAYYNISIGTFVNNVIVLGIENCLIRKLPSILTVNKVSLMDDEELRELAAESTNNQRDRVELKREYDVMSRTVQTLEQYRLRTPSAVLPRVAVQPVPREHDSKIALPPQIPSFISTITLQKRSSHKGSPTDKKPTTSGPGTITTTIATAEPTLPNGGRGRSSSPSSNNKTKEGVVEGSAVGAVETKQLAQVNQYPRFHSEYSSSFYSQNMNKYGAYNQGGYGGGPYGQGGVYGQSQYGMSPQGPYPPMTMTPTSSTASFANNAPSPCSPTFFPWVPTPSNSFNPSGGGGFASYSDANSPFKSRLQTTANPFTSPQPSFGGGKGVTKSLANQPKASIATGTVGGRSFDGARTTEEKKKTTSLFGIPEKPKSATTTGSLLGNGGAITGDKKNSNMPKFDLLEDMMVTSGGRSGSDSLFAVCASRQQEE